MTAIRIELQLADGSFTSGMMRAGQSLSHFKSELARVNPQFDRLRAKGQDAFLMFNRQAGAATSFGTKLRNLSIIMGGLTLAFRGLTGAGNGTLGSLVRINSEMERLRYQLAGMSDAADPMAEAAAQIENLQDLAASAPFSLGELANSFVKLKAAGLDPTNGSLRALTDGLAAFGASDENLHRVTIALTQMQGKGVLSMEELRQQLGESMPTAMRLMARSMGVTVGELTRLVSTGQVESRSALQRWFAEVQRSYAGAGQYMMQSFSGLVTRLKTEMTQLTTRGEMKNAFDQLKQYLGELIEFLGTPRAQEFFDSMGRGLQSAMALAENLVRHISSLFDWFKKIAPVALAVMGVSGAVAGARLLGSAFGRMKMDIIAVGVAASRTRAAVAAMMSTSAVTSANNAVLITARRARTAEQARLQAAQAGAAASSAASAASAIPTGGFAAGRTALTSMVAVGGRLLGLLGPIAMGITVLGPLAFEVGRGIHSWYTGANEANQAIRNTVSVQTEVLRQQRAAQRERLVAERERAERMNQEYYDQNGDSNNALLRNLERANQAVWDFDDETSSSIENFLNQEENVRAQVEEAMTRMAEGRRQLSRTYNTAANELDTEYQDALDASRAGTSDETQRQVQDRINERRSRLQRDQIQGVIDLYNEQISVMRSMETQGVMSEGAITEMIRQRLELEQQRDNLSPDNFNVDLMSGFESEEKKAERLQTAMENARERVAGLTAELNGASGALARLIFRINRGDFGNLDDATEAAENMRNMLVEATIAAETLDEVTKNFDNAQSEIDRINDSLREESLRLRAEIAGIDTNNALDMFNWQRANGELEGIGATAEETIQRAMEAVTQGADLTSSAFTSLGDAIRNGAFGTDSMSRIQAVRDMMLQISGAVNSATTGFNQGMMQTPGGLGSVNGYTPLAADVDYIQYNNQGGVRSQPLSPQLTQALSFLREMGITMSVFSGGQDGIETGSTRRIGSTRHDHGNAADATFSMGGRQLDWANPRDQPIFVEIVRRAMGAGLTGFGAAEGYMGAGSMHLGFGSEAIWGGSGENSGRPPHPFLLEAQRLGPLNSMIAPATYDTMVTGVGQRQNELTTAQDEANAQEIENRRLRAQAALLRMRREIEAGGAGQEDEDGALSTYGVMGRRARAANQRNEFAGQTPEDIEELIRLADEYDARQTRITQMSRDQRDVEQNRQRIADELVEIEQRRQDALARARDPNYQAQSTEMRNLGRLEREQLQIAERLYGVNSDQYRLEVQRLASQRAALQTSEAAEALADLARASEESTRGALGVGETQDAQQRQQRQRAFDERIAQLTALRDRAIADGALVAEANMMFERAVAAERARLREENQTALHQSLAQMGDLEGSLNQTISSLPQTLSNGLYDALTGGDIGDAFDTIREQLARNFLDAAVSTLMSPFEEFLGGNGTQGSGLAGMIQSLVTSMTESLGGLMKGGGSSAMSGIGGLLKKTAGVAHTGGIAGALTGAGRRAGAGHFLNAPKFHTGGIIGARSLKAMSSGLTPNEVPIIARRGEGVFTPEQMKHMGGNVSNRAVSISAPITVNANGGTPEQNADLASQIADKSQAMFRGLVRQELGFQMRPGGMLT